MLFLQACARVCAQLSPWIKDRLGMCSIVTLSLFLSIVSNDTVCIYNQPKHIRLSWWKLTSEATNSPYVQVDYSLLVVSSFEHHCGFIAGLQHVWHYHRSPNELYTSAHLTTATTEGRRQPLLTGLVENDGDDNDAQVEMEREQETTMDGVLGCTPTFPMATNLTREPCGWRHGA